MSLWQERVFGYMPRNKLGGSQTCFGFLFPLCIFSWEFNACLQWSVILTILHSPSSSCPGFPNTSLSHLHVLTVQSLWNLHADFYGGCSGIHSHQQWTCVQLSPHPHQHSTFFFLFTYFLCVCMTVHHICAVTREARRECQIPWDWSYRWLWATYRCRESNPDHRKRS